MVEPPVFDAIQVSSSPTAARRRRRSLPRSRGCSYQPPSIRLRTRRRGSRLGDAAHSRAGSRSTMRSWSDAIAIAESGAHPAQNPSRRPSPTTMWRDLLGQLLHELATPPMVADMPWWIPPLPTGRSRRLARHQDASSGPAARGSGQLAGCTAGSGTARITTSVRSPPSTLPYRVLDAEHGAHRVGGHAEQPRPSLRDRLEGPWRENQVRARSRPTTKRCARSRRTSRPPSVHRRWRTSPTHTIGGRRAAATKTETTPSSCTDRALGLLGADDMSWRNERRSRSTPQSPAVSALLGTGATTSSARDRDVRGGARRPRHEYDGA